MSHKNFNLENIKKIIKIFVKSLIFRKKDLKKKSSLSTLKIEKFFFYLKERIFDPNLMTTSKFLIIILFKVNDLKISHKKENEILNVTSTPNSNFFILRFRQNSPESLVRNFSLLSLLEYSYYFILSSKYH